MMPIIYLVVLVAFDPVTFLIFDLVAIMRLVISHTKSQVIVSECRHVKRGDSGVHGSRLFSEIYYYNMALLIKHCYYSGISILSFPRLHSREEIVKTFDLHLLIIAHYEVARIPVLFTTSVPLYHVTESLVYEANRRNIT